MKKNTMRKLGALTGAVTMLSGAAAAMADTAVAAGAEVTLRQEAAFDAVANVKGEFSFTQNTVTPPSEVFNLFGTVATGVCATPNFAFDAVTEENYFINVGGSIQKERTQKISLAELKSMPGEQRLMKCSCATGAALANAQVVGVPLSNLAAMVDLEEKANTVTFTSGDGYKVSVPLRYALEKDAILAYQIGDEAIASGVQVWMPKSVARYFARNVVDVEFTAEAVLPELLEADAEQRAKVSVLNNIDGVFSVGEKIAFEGFADDFDQAIAAVEFSMDNGNTWTSCETAGASAERWVNWTFSYVTEAAGNYKLDVRARSVDGTVSPLASSVTFVVE